MDDVTTAQSTRSSKPLLIIGGIVILVFVVVLLSAKGGLNLPGGKANPTPASGSATSGKMYLASVTNQKVFNVGDTIVLDLRIDTRSQEVGGYDAVITFDSSVIEFEKAENLVPDFEMFTNQLAPSGAGSTVSITGIMQLEKQTPYAFHEDPVARLTFKAKSIGSTTIAFQFQKGETNDSNLVLTNTEEILGAVENYSLAVARAQTLTVGNTFTDPASGLRIKLESITVPEPVCNDCTTDAFFTISRGGDGTSGETQSLTFSNGGIAGKMIDSRRVAGHIIEVKNITGKSLEISVVAEQ